MCVYVCNSIRASVSGLPDPSCPVVYFNHYNLHSFIHLAINNIVVLEAYFDAYVMSCGILALMLCYAIFRSSDNRLHYVTRYIWHWVKFRR